MCGIAGFWTPSHATAEAESVIRRMTGCVRHRGPDGDGITFDPEVGLAFGHRRLAIQDLSREGAQPMSSASGRFRMIYNGEVYNAPALRESLGDVAWRGHSDTEVMLAAFERWGVAAAVPRFAGMFACAVWDATRGELHLIRDRLGIKPLYYGVSDGVLLFGSELKALRAHPAFDGTLDVEGVAQFLRYDYVPGPTSIYARMRKLVPGTILTLRTPGDAAEPVPYWSALDAAVRGQADPFRGTLEDATDALDGLLRQVVGEHLISDVPVGAFLSGGIDSSTVVATMQAVAGGAPVRTFAIGFEEPRFDEAPHARAVAKALGTSHTELYVTADDALALLPRLPDVYDEPFADSSQLPTMLVSALTRRHVTVSLSGDGGDELFAGYSRYAGSERLWRSVARVPRPVRRGLTRLLRAVPPKPVDLLLSPVRAALPPRLQRHARGARLQVLADYLAPTSAPEMYQRVLMHVDPKSALGPAAPALARSFARRDADGALGSFLHHMMWWDQTTYLPDDILVKVDRASMAVGLEARVPLLDHRIVEFSWTLPEALLAAGGRTKLPLRGVLGRHVPLALVDRPKMGFSTPIGAWLRGPLRQWMGDLLAPAHVARLGVLDTAVVARLHKEHLSGEAEHGWALWSLLMLVAWYDRQAGVEVPA
jgi:asparagine synthase (glutamine-hydrolysing)